MTIIISQSPWEVLGVARDADAAAIKRAYAGKLKFFRPDEDPDGFQRLREARDVAMRISEYRAREERELIEVEDDQAAEEVEDRGVDTNDAGFESEAADPLELPANDASANPPSPSPLVGESGEGGTAGSVQNLPPPSLPPSGFPPPPTPPHQGEGSSRSAINKPATPPPTPSADHLALEAIDARVLEGSDPWDREAWRRIMEWIAETGFEERGRIERSIVGKLSELLQGPSWTAAEQTSLLRRLLRPAKLRQAEAKENAVRRSRAHVLRVLDEEFGWSRDDRMLYATLGPELADRLADHVREARAADPDVARTQVFPPRRRADGFPVLEERDLVAYLVSKRATHYLSFYQTARHAGAYPMDWSFAGLLFPFLVPLRARRWGFAFLLFAGDMLAGVAVIALASAKHTVLAAVPLLAQAGIHLFAGLQAKRWLIEAAARAIERADQRALVFAAERARFLKRAGSVSALAIIAAIFLAAMIEGELIAYLDEPKATTSPDPVPRNPP